MDSCGILSLLNCGINYFKSSCNQQENQEQLTRLMPTQPTYNAPQRMPSFSSENLSSQEAYIALKHGRPTAYLQGDARKMKIFIIKKDVSFEQSIFNMTTKQFGMFPVSKTIERTALQKGLDKELFVERAGFSQLETLQGWFTEGKLDHNHLL